MIDQKEFSNIRKLAADIDYYMGICTEIDYGDQIDYVAKQIYHYHIKPLQRKISVLRKRKV